MKKEKKKHAEEGAQQCERGNTSANGREKDKYKSGM
jgi:hypothetical protein